MMRISCTITRTPYCLSPTTPSIRGVRSSICFTMRRTLPLTASLRSRPVHAAGIVRGRFESRLGERTVEPGAGRIAVRREARREGKRQHRPSQRSNSKSGYTFPCMPKRGAALLAMPGDLFRLRVGEIKATGIPITIMS
jgi:hypothetical protein